MSNTRSTNTGAPQGCVLSPLLVPLYTNDCTSTDPSVKLLKSADDTTLISLIKDGYKSAYRQEDKEQPGAQPGAQPAQNSGDDNRLQDKSPCTLRIHHHRQHSDCSGDFKFLGSIISQDLDWDTHITSIVKIKPNKGCTSFTSSGRLTRHRSF